MIKFLLGAVLSAAMCYTCMAEIHFVIENDEDIELIRANKSEYQNNIVKLSGNVSIKYGDKIIKSDVVNVDMSKRNISASGNITIEDSEGNTITADTIQIKNKFSDGLLRKIKITLNDRSYLKSEDASFEGRNYFEMNQAEYSPCYDCVVGDRLTWKIRAKHVEQKDDVMIYKHAFWDILDVPVIYIPYLSIPAFGVKRKSGFLFPIFSFSKINGVCVCPRYLCSISNSQELILKPILTTKIGTAMWASYAYRFNSGMFDIDTSFAGIKSVKNIDKNDVNAPDQRELLKINSNNYRGHLFSNFRYDIDRHYRISLKLNLASDKYYLRKFPFLQNEDIRLLESNISIERFYKDDYASIKTMYFQTLRPEEKNSDIPLILPVITYSSIHDVLSGALSLDVLAMHLNFASDHDTNKLFANISWKKDFVLRYGHIITADLVLSSSFHSISYRRSTASNVDSSLTDISPILSLIWQWPLQIFAKKKDITAIIKPVCGIIYSQNRKINSVYNDPYTSVYFFELTDYNFLEAIRSPFSVQANDGSRIPYGLFGSIQNKSGVLMDFSVGRSFRISDAKSTVSDLKNKHSNIISTLNIYPTDELTLFMNTSYSTSDHKMKKVETGIKYENEYVKFRSDIFRYVSSVAHSAVQNTYKGMHINLEARVSKKLSINGGIIAGDKNCRLLKKTVGVAYKNECFSAHLMYAQHDFRSGDIKPDRSISLLFVFKNLGKMDFKI